MSEESAGSWTWACTTRRAGLPGQPGVPHLRANGASAAPGSAVPVAAENGAATRHPPAGAAPDAHRCAAGDQRAKAQPAVRLVLPEARLAVLRQPPTRGRLDAASLASFPPWPNHSRTPARYRGGSFRLEV